MGVSLATALLLAAWRGECLQASTQVWTEAGTGDLWSDAANWSGGVPIGGDDVLFGTQGGGSSVVNFSLSLAAFRFAPAILPAHDIHITSALTLTGAGIDNQSWLPNFGDPPNPPGTIRQQFFAESGGTLTFQSGATVGGTLPVDLNAMGGSAINSAGRIIFEGTSSASGGLSPVFTGLRAYGATAPGANGGELIFRGNSSTGLHTSLFVAAGEGANAQGGAATFEGNATASGLVSNLTGDGLGGRITFRGNASAGGSLVLDNYGAVGGAVGAEAVVQFLDDSSLRGVAQNFSGTADGFAGGRIEFRQRARLDSTGYAGGQGFQLLNRGSYFLPLLGTSAGLGGRTVFYDDSRVEGLNITITNGSGTEEEDVNPGGQGGVTEFRDRARAGQVTIVNVGATSAALGTTGGQTFFRDQSSAESATIFANGGSLAAEAFGGVVEFSGSATAANAILTARRSSGIGAGGKILFIESAQGGSAQVTVEAGATFDMSGLAISGTTLGSIAGDGTFFLGGKTLAVGNAVSTVVGGVLADGGQGGGTGGALTKVGTGTLELAGVNTYTGATAVNGGALLITGSLSGGAVSVANGATLGGTGMIGGAVAVDNGGVVAPGKFGAGTLTMGDLTLNAGSQLNFQLGSVSDRIDINGALVLDGTLNVAPSTSGLVAGVYRLLNYTGAYTHQGLDFGLLPPGTTAADFMLQTSVVGQVNLILGASSGELLFWDGTNFGANGVIEGGSGTWTNTATNWTNATGGVQQAWTGRTAVFSGTGGTVTLGENVSVRGLQFATSGYVINSAAGQAITLDPGTLVRVEAGASARIRSVLTGTSLNKDGDGTLVLSANNTYAGGTTVTNGQLAVDNPAGLGLGTGPVDNLASPTTYLHFFSNASAGVITITNHGSPDAVNFSVTLFSNTARAGSAHLINLGNPNLGGRSGLTQFRDTTSAENAWIENRGGNFADSTPSSLGAGSLIFIGAASAGAATITNFGGTANDAGGGETRFFETTSAGTAMITARGAQVAGARGGAIRFFGTANAAQATLRAEAGANDGRGARIEFHESSSGGTARVMLGADAANPGQLDVSQLAVNGTSVGSLEGGGAVFLGGKKLTVGGNHLSTEFFGSITDFGGAAGGSGGELIKVGNGSLTLVGNSFYFGATDVRSGQLIVRNAAGFGLGQNLVSVQAGAELRLVENSVYGGSTVLVNVSASAVVGLGGFTSFQGTSRAGSVTITNEGGLQADWDPGLTFFASQSSAGSAIILNTSGNAGGEGGETRFFNDATAENARITNVSSIGSVSGAGKLSFTGHATAGSARISNQGAEVLGAGSGEITFTDTASAGNALIANLGGRANSAAGSVTNFREFSYGGSAKITNHAGTSASGGVTRFFDDANAQGATILNQSPITVSSGSGQLAFNDRSSAGAALITNEGARLSGTGAGATFFLGSAQAGAAAIVNEGSSFALGVNSSGGATLFYQNAQGGSATIINRGATSTNGGSGQTTFSGTTHAQNAAITNLGSSGNDSFGGVTVFEATASAGQATIVNAGGLPVTGGTGTVGGVTKFLGGASAGSASFTNEGGLPAGITSFGRESGGRVEFNDTATAGAATFLNRGGTRGAAGGRIEFRGSSRAGTAQFRNEGGISARENDGESGMLFYGNSTAETATIVNVGGTLATSQGALTAFYDNTQAGTAAITAEGAIVAGGEGADISFLVDSQAGQALLTAGSGTNGGEGGSIFFSGTSSGGNARVVLRSGPGLSAGLLDISALLSPGTTVGSIEGGGVIGLGSRRLTVGGNHLSTEFSGVIRDEAFTSAVGGQLTKIGSGTLKLSGQNIFTGKTTVLEGRLIVTGSLSGVVEVQGGVLGGNGQFNGGIVVGPGGIVAPGQSIGTLETSGLLTFDDGSVFGLEVDLGVGSADRINASGVAIGAGVTVDGQLYGSSSLGVLGQEFLVLDNRSLDPIAGTFSGLPEGSELQMGAARFQISYFGGDGNDFTLTNLVPEPGCAALLSVAALVLTQGRRRRKWSLKHNYVAILSR